MFAEVKRQDDTNTRNERRKLINTSKTTRMIGIDEKTTLRIVQSYGMHNFRLSQILLKSAEQ
jgi:hypothetical protein